MKRTKTVETAGDLFSAAAGGEEVAPTALIASPLVAETAGWLEKRAKTLGSLLSSERAVEYVAILRAFVKFREGHEPEPLHEDLARDVCGEDAAPDAESLFKGDIRQLKDWELVTWITPRKVGSKADVASIEQARGERLKNWMRQVGVYPSAGNAIRLGGGRYETFADCRGIVDVITATRLGGGQRAKRHLEIVGTPCAETIQVSVAEGELSFQDLEMMALNGPENGDN